MSIFQSPEGSTISLWKILLFSACLLIALMEYKSCNNRVSDANLMNALNDSIKTYVDDKGRLVSENMVLNTDYNTFKNLNAGKDSVIKKLQKEIDRKTATIVYISSRTASTGTGKTEIVYEPVPYPKDTTRWNTVHDTIYPIYKNKGKDKWSEWNIIANKDSVFHSVISYDTYIIKQEWKRDKWYKDKYLALQITNENPNSKVIDQKALNFQGQKGNKLKWAGYGVIVGIIGTFILTK